MLMLHTAIDDNFDASSSFMRDSLLHDEWLSLLQHSTAEAVTITRQQDLYSARPAHMLPAWRVPSFDQLRLSQSASFLGWTEH